MSHSPTPTNPTPTPSLPDLPWPPSWFLLLLLPILTALNASLAFLAYLLHFPPPRFRHTLLGRAWKRLRMQGRGARRGGYEGLELGRQGGVVGDEHEYEDEDEDENEGESERGEGVEMRVYERSREMGQESEGRDTVTSAPELSHGSSATAAMLPQQQRLARFDSPTTTHDRLSGSHAQTPVQTWTRETYTTTARDAAASPLAHTRSSAASHLTLSRNLGLGLDSGVGQGLGLTGDGYTAVNGTGSSKDGGSECNDSSSSNDSDSDLDSEDSSDDQEPEHELKGFLARVSQAVDRAAEKFARLTEGDGGEDELVMSITAAERGEESGGDDAR